MSLFLGADEKVPEWKNQMKAIVSKLRKRASKGTTDDLVKLVDLYEQWGDDDERKERIELLRLGAEEGNARAEYLLGKVLLFGVDVERDEELAFSTLKSAARKNDPNASFYLAFCLYNGIGQSANREGALKELERAAKLGSPAAMLATALLAREGEIKLADGKEKTIVDYLRRASAAGALDATVLYANALEFGRGVEKNGKKAAELYRRAAERGHSEGMYFYGRALLEGKIVERDVEGAKKWLRRAGERGCADASAFCD